ncbi:MAG: hypothetical protein K8F25_09300 [Fimbriimonadaceae bacterium]|nr:hypothetical protein [Alphaproteobacteria bacterium]
MRKMKKILAKSRISLFLAGASLIAVGGCSGGSIGDFMGQDITALASNSISALTGQEGTAAQNQRLDSRTRAPLVMPPSDTLQTPASQDQTASLLGGDWPDDPDVRAQQELEALKAERNTVNAKENDRIMGAAGQAVPLTVEEMRRRKPDPNHVREVQDPGDRPDGAAPMSPDELLGRRLDPNRDRSRERPLLARRASAGGLIEPPRRNVAPPIQPGDLEAMPEKKSLLDRLRFWRRN